MESGAEQQNNAGWVTELDGPDRVAFIKPFEIQQSFLLMFGERDSLELFAVENTCTGISCFSCTFLSELSRASASSRTSLLSVCVSLTLMSPEHRQQSCQEMPQTSKCLHTAAQSPKVPLMMSLVCQEQRKK